MSRLKKFEILQNKTEIETRPRITCKNVEEKKKNQSRINFNEVDRINKFVKRSLEKVRKSHV